MEKRGYTGEYKTKQELIKKYGKENVIKIAIGGAMDFIVVKDDRIIRIIETKETAKKKYYPTQKESEQIKRIIQFGESHKIKCELYIFYRKGAGIKIVKEVKVLYDPNVM